MAYQKLQARYWECSVAPANVSGKGINHGGLITTSTGLKLSGWWVDVNDFVGLYWTALDQLDHFNLRYSTPANPGGDLTNCKLDCDLTAWSNVKAPDTQAADFGIRAFGEDGILRSYFVTSINYATGNGTAASGTITLGGTPASGDNYFCYINGWYSQYLVQAGDTLQSIAAGLAAAINKNNNLTSLVSASAVNTNVVTITAKLQGTSGNSITLSVGSILVGGSTGTITASGATLTGGVEPTSWHYHFDFNNLTDTLGRLVPVRRVDSILWTWLPGSAGAAFSAQLDNWTPGGNVSLGAEPANLAANGLGVSINYDAVWNLTPERIITNLQRLGYNGRLDFFIGSEKYYRKQVIGSVNYTAGRLYQVDSAVAFNQAATDWFTDFLTRAKSAGFSVMAELGMECVDPKAGWVQQSSQGSIASSQSGSNPTLFVLSPSPSDLRTFIQLVATTMAGLENTAGLTPQIQFAEWQWWAALSAPDGSQTVPFFYDSATITAFLNLQPPVASLSQAAGGSLGARTEYYALSYVFAISEGTVQGTVASINALASNLVTVASPPAFTQNGMAATGYNVYATPSNGGIPVLQNSSPIAIGTNWTEPTTGIVGTGRTRNGASPHVYVNSTAAPSDDQFYPLEVNFLANQFGSLMAALISAVRATYPNTKVEADYYNPSIDTSALMQQATYDTNNINSTKLNTLKTSCYGWTRTGDLANQLNSIKFPQTYVGAATGNNTALNFSAANSVHVCGFAIDQQDWLAVANEITVCKNNGIGVIQVWDYYLIQKDGFFGSINPLKNLLIPQGMSHTVTDLEGSNSISEWEIDLIDPDGTIRSLASKKVFESRTGRILLGYPSLNSTEFVPIFHFQILRVEQSANNDGLWNIMVNDIQRYGKQKIFLEGSTDTGKQPLLKGNGAAISKGNPRVIRANPMDILLAILQNELGLGQSQQYSRGDWTLYDPTNQSSTLINPNPLIDVAGILNLRDTIFAGEIFEFSLTAAEDAKQFIETEIMKANGAYPLIKASNLGAFSVSQPHSLGLYSLRTLRPPPSALTPLWAFTDKNTMGLPQIQRSPVINKVTIRFDNDGSKFNTELTFTEPASILLYDIEQPYVYESKGIKSQWGGARKARALANRLLRRYAFGTPLYTIKSFAQAVVVEIGDYVSLTHPQVRDPITGNVGLTSVTCEVLGRRPDHQNAVIEFDLLDTRSMKVGSVFNIAAVSKNLPSFPVASLSDQQKYMFVSNASLGGTYSNGTAGNTIY